MEWVRIAIAAVGLAVVFVLIARRERRLRTGTLDGSTLRRRVAEPGAGSRRIQARLDDLGFRFIGDFDLCDAGGRRLHRFTVSWNEHQATLALRGREVFSYFTELVGRETHPATIVVQTSAFDVDRTHPRYVIQTIRGVKDVSEAARLRIHDDAIDALGVEGWEERRRQPDPVAFAHAVLVDTAEAHAIGDRRRNLSLGHAARRVFSEGTAQIGAAVANASDPAELPDRPDDGP